MTSSTKHLAFLVSPFASLFRCSSSWMTSAIRSNTSVCYPQPNDYASGPWSCTWLSHAPWYGVTRTTTPASLPPFVRYCPSQPSCFQERQRGSPVAIWLRRWGRVGFRIRSP
jgi:hypothetical protein